MSQANNPTIQMHAVISMFAFFLCAGVLVTSIMLSQQASTHCEHYIELPLIIMSSILLALSILGIFAAYKGVEWITWLCGCVPASVLIVLMFVLTAYVFKATSTTPIKGHTVGNDKSWFNNRVNKNWNKISTCLEHNKICDNTDETNHTVLSIQTGCCKPADDCNFNTSSNSSSTNPDCTKWNSDPKVLCYACDSCKIGWTNNIGWNWKRVAIIDMIFLSPIAITVLVSTCLYYMYHH